MRIRLEGAAETLEKACQRYRWARSLFKEPWRNRAGRHAAALERMKNEEPLVEEAVQKVERLVEREGWGEGSEPARLLVQLRRARAELIAHLDPLLALTTPLTETGRFSDHFATGRIVWMLEYVLAELVPPTTAEPLVSAQLSASSATRTGAMLLSVLGVSVLVALLASHFGLLTFFLIWPGLIFTRSWSRLELLPDRLRLRRPFRKTTEVRLPKGGIHYDPLGASLSIAGLGAIELKTVDDAASIATLLELFTHPPFDTLGTRPSTEGTVLDASRTTGRTGAVVLAGRRSVFVEDGIPTFDSAIGKSAAWASPKARLLGLALLALDQPRRDAIFDALLASGSAQEVDLGNGLFLARGAAYIGDLKIEVGERQARGVQRWLRNR